MEDWKVDRRKRGCSGCGREFESEEAHYSAIRLAGAAFERLDVCARCWETVFPPDREPPFSFWSTKAPRREKRRLEDVTAMVEFFKRLAARSSRDPSQDKVLYLVALLLLRKRRLKHAGARTAGGATTILLEKTWDGETVEIPCPAISEEELGTLRLELERLFDVELSADQAASA